MGGSLLMERAVQVLKKAGVEDVLIITAHKAYLLEPVIERLGARRIHNHAYEQGMFSSIRAGVETLAEDIDAFFLLPADYPLVSSDTVRKLLEEYRRNPRQILYPVYNGKRGHPPLISAALRASILAEEPDGGLKALLEAETADYLEIEVADEGILTDIASEEEYRRLTRDILALYPTRQECDRILRGNHTPEPVVLHAVQVSKVACKLCEYANSRGLLIHTAMVMAGALLHDIAKGEKDHPFKGKKIADQLGYPEVGDIIAAHMDLPQEHLNAINEYSILYLADKLIDGDRVVTLETRLAAQRERYGSDALAGQNVLVRMGKAMQVQKKIEAYLGIKLGELLADLDEGKP